MKQLHRSDLFGWSVFNEGQNIDFNGVLWTRAQGNLLIDPVVPSAHDLARLRALGGVSWIVVTNSAHLRASQALAQTFGARLAGPAAEQATFAVRCDRWLSDGDEVVPGLTAFELQGSKTPGELALWLAPDTLIFGDLVRCHAAGSLTLLGAEKLRDRAAALASVARLLEKPATAVLVGDGFCVYREGRTCLRELVGAQASAGS